MMGIETAILLGLTVAERIIKISDQYAQRRANSPEPSKKVENIIDRLERLRKELGDGRT